MYNRKLGENKFDVGEFLCYDLIFFLGYFINMVRIVFVDIVRR